MFQIGCCGADGPNDYLALRHALPTECRDTVTGNAFFYGCAEEVTWFLEYKSRWTTNIAIAIAALEVRRIRDDYVRISVFHEFHTLIVPVPRVSYRSVEGVGRMGEIAPGRSGLVRAFRISLCGYLWSAPRENHAPGRCYRSTRLFVRHEDVWT